METSSLTFAQPGWFLALLLVPAFAGLYFWSQRRSDALIAKIVAPRLKAQLAGAVSVSLRAFRAVLILTAMALVVVAMARPQKGFIEREITHHGRDIIIAVDTSRSMLATDVTPTRLARAKLVAQDLMRLCESDRIGLVAFAGSAFLQAPLTLDQTAVLNSLDELDTTIIPKGGTDIAAAIAEAEKAFGKSEGKTRALIILTDGEELDADGIAAARDAAKRGIRIFTVGIGSSEGSLIPIRIDGGGSNDFVRDTAGKPVQSRLDESRLKEIAAATGGFYTPLSADAARTIFEKGIVPMEQSNAGVATAREPIERYQWPLGAAIALLGLWMIVGDRRRVPSRFATAAILLLASLPSLSAATGLEEYNAGNYPQAMETFSKQLQSAPDSEKLLFNSGAAAYKMGDFGKAVDYFTKAILAEDTKLREEASYNLGNALVRRGEAAKGNDEKKADWKNAIQHYTQALNIDPKDKNAKENRDIVKKMLEDLEKQEKQQQQQQDKQDQKDQKDQKKDQQQNQQQNQNQNQQNKDQKDQSQQNQNQKQDQQKQDQKDQQNQQNKDQQNQGGQQGDQKKDQSGQDQKDQDKKQDQQQQQSQNGDQKKDDQQKQDQQSQPQQGDQKQDQQKGQQQQQQAQNQQNKDQKGQPSPTPGEKKQGDLQASGDQKQDQQQQQAAEAQAGGGEEQKDGEMSAAQARSLLNSLRSDEERVNLMQRQDTEDTVKDW